MLKKNYYVVPLFPKKFLNIKMRVLLFIKNVTFLSDPSGSMDNVGDEKDFPLFCDLRSQCCITSWIISFETKKVK